MGRAERRSRRGRSLQLTTSLAFILLAVAFAAVLSQAGAAAGTHAGAPSDGSATLALAAHRGVATTSRRPHRLASPATLCSTVLRRNHGARVAPPINTYCARMLERTSRKHHGRHASSRATRVPNPTAALPTPSASLASAATAKRPPLTQPATKHPCAHTATTSGCVGRTLANLMPALTPSGTAQIKGTVTSAVTSKAVEGIEVCAYTEVVFQCATTGVTGEYRPHRSERGRIHRLLRGAVRTRRQLPDPVLQRQEQSCGSHARRSWLGSYRDRHQRGPARRRADHRQGDRCSK